MKMTKEILQNIIKEELESVLSEMSLNEQERNFISKLGKVGDPLGLVQRGRKFVDKFKGAQGERYKSRKQAAAALATAAVPKTPLGQTVLALQNELRGFYEARDEQMATLLGRIETLEEKVAKVTKA